MVASKPELAPPPSMTRRSPAGSPGRGRACGRRPASDARWPADMRRAWHDALMPARRPPLARTERWDPPCAIDEIDEIALRSAPDQENPPRHRARPAPAVAARRARGRDPRPHRLGPGAAQDIEPVDVLARHAGQGDADLEVLVMLRAKARAACSPALKPRSSCGLLSSRSAATVTSGSRAKARRLGCRWWTGPRPVRPPGLDLGRGARRRARP